MEILGRCVETFEHALEVTGARCLHSQQRCREREKH
jgi:hypothetical protein